MKIKNDDLHFYELLRDFLHKYLVVQRQFSEATVRNYTDSLNQFRIYLREQKHIPFDELGFHCFTREMIYGFCIWLWDDQHKAVNTVLCGLISCGSIVRTGGSQKRIGGPHNAKYSIIEF